MSEELYQPTTTPPPATGGFQVNPETNPGGTAAPVAPVNSDENIDLRIAAAVEARMAGIASAYDAKIKALEKRYEASLKSARGIRPVDHQVPTHGGGAGNEIHQTWSQYHQELASAGLLTPDHVNLTQGFDREEVTADA